jgi:hypothetical protein
MMEISNLKFENDEGFLITLGKTFLNAFIVTSSILLLAFRISILSRISSLMSSFPAVLAADLNSSSRWDNACSAAVAALMALIGSVSLIANSQSSRQFKSHLGRS